NFAAVRPASQERGRLHICRVWYFGLPDHHFCGEARLISVMPAASALVQTLVSGFDRTSDQRSSPGNFAARSWKNRLVFRQCQSDALFDLTTSSASNAGIRAKC